MLLPAFSYGLLKKLTTRPNTWESIYYEAYLLLCCRVYSPCWNPPGSTSLSTTASYGAENESPPAARMRVMTACSGVAGPNSTPPALSSARSRSARDVCPVPCARDVGAVPGYIADEQESGKNKVQMQRQ